MKHKMKFGENLKNELAVAHLSQEKLAKMLNTKQATVSRWTSGKNQPDLETLFLICEILNTTPNVLLGWEE